ncbi:hypothetical protein I317_05785 [Kwoniella heveanensis CBS 569]|nr:hypothetical protein I317_05785 [Kwoniella heveanensis CBS 569]
MADPTSPISTASSVPSSSSSTSQSSGGAAPSTASSAQQPLPPIQPLRNPKYRHISRSAAKRESVQLLGSIKDLQLHFSRAGLVEHRPGAGVGVKSTGAPALGDSGLGSLGEEEEVENRPFSASSSYVHGGTSAGNSAKTRERKPFKDVELPRLDLGDARREARGIVSDVRGIWGLSVPVAPPSPGSAPAPTSALPSSKSLYFPTNFQDILLQDGPSYQEYRNSEDVHTALVNTARSIRRIRFLALSISHAHGIAGGLASSGRKASGSLLPLRLGGAGKLRSSLSTPSRPAGPPRAVSGGSYTTERKGSLGRTDNRGGDDDILGDLRKAALDVLAALRALEERLRVIRDEGKDGEEGVGSELEQRSPTPTPLEEGDHSDQFQFTPPGDEGDARMSTSALNRETPPVFSEPEGYYDSDEDDLFNVNALAQADTNPDSDHTTTWEERIVSEKREYRVLDDSEWEREARATREGVGKWVAVVERMFVFAAPGEDGAEGGDGGAELEDWARDDGGEIGGLERVHSFLLSHLPLDLALRLPVPSSDGFRARFMSALSDGYILIHAYNASLLRSSKPWGFIPDEDVHDTLSSTLAGAATDAPVADEGGKKEREWTFRRVGNLTCWGAALRHRYQLPLSIITSGPTATFASPFLPLPTSSSHGATSSGTSTPMPAPSRPRPSIDTNSTGKVVSPSGTAKNNNKEEAIDFDPMMIAKHTAGWDEMLSRVVGRWVREVGKEIRESRGFRIKIGAGRAVSGDEDGVGLRRGGLI